MYDGKDYGAEVDLLERRFQRFGTKPVRRVLDRSPAMLAIAGARAAGGRFVHGDMCTVSLGDTYDAVVILFAALCYQTTPDAITAALRTARRHLADGGLLLADVCLPLASSGGG